MNLRLAVVLLAATPLLLPRAVAQGGKKATPPTIAIVDPARVQRESKWAASLLIDIKRAHADNVRTLEPKEKKLVQLEKDLKLWQPGSPEHDRKSLEIGVLRTELKNAGQMFQSWYNRKMFEAVAAVTTEIDKRCAVIAKKRGIQLVLKHLAIPKGLSLQDRVVAIQRRQVLYFDPKLDITRQVIDMLDADRAGGAANASGKAPGKSPGKANGK